jgi:hypothetical protein
LDAAAGAVVGLVVAADAVVGLVVAADAAPVGWVAPGLLVLVAIAFVPIVGIVSHTQWGNPATRKPAPSAAPG